MARIINLFFWSSGFLFLVALLYVYAFLPIKVGMLFDSSGLPTFSITKEMLFYSAIILFATTNGLIHLYRKMMKGGRSFHTYEWVEMSREETVYFWLSGFSASLNFLYVFCILFLGMYHNQEHFNISNFVFLVYIGPIFLIAWIFSLFYFLKIGKQNKL